MAIFVTDAVFLFLSMKDYKDSMSSSCLECSFWKDIFVFLLIGMGVLAILLTILFRIVKKRGYLYDKIIHRLGGVHSPYSMFKKVSLNFS